MRQLFPILTFYRPYFLWSFAANIILFFLLWSYLIPVFLAKIFLVIFLWYSINQSHAKRKLMFYKNLGISTFKLFAMLFLVDLALSIPFLLILKEFT